ncbi:sugar transferase [Solirubrobacter sp. CPCC 204708]|uniref:Sugar transferase n=1 Tax=Solirubrobacter deserti TaxID=2282478 RepID=A0ABT4RM44_9ACTN|nr:sugar transferase [Solirubrobacter deserti]MBE2317960.1 sugar transferase [Solirubrobacter deserti]MDA0139639.1 sugar transferase [Solirubrobacter deserti]
MAFVTKEPRVASRPPAPPFLLETAPPAAVRRRDRGFRRGLLLADVAASLLVSLVVGIWVDPTALSLGHVLLLPLLVAIVNTAGGMYERDEKLINKSTLDETPATLQHAALVSVLALIAGAALRGTWSDPTTIAATWIGLVLAITVLRIVARLVVRALMPPERCLVVGDHDHGRRLARRLVDGTTSKVELTGILALPEAAAAHGQLSAEVASGDVHRVIIAADASGSQAELHTIQAAKALGVKVSVVPRVLEVLGSSATYDYIDGLTVLGIPRFGLSRTAKITKRSFDLAGSLFLLVALAPMLAVIALVIKLTSPGPVLFSQTRIGRNGEPFSMFKFRSMSEDAELLKDMLRARNEADGLFKIVDDPRITPVGRILRRSSLDELPQLLNVLRGEMSLVGPRPLIPEEDGKIRGWHRRRLQLTPGMTGPWQVLGAARMSLHEMVTIDYQYVGNWSLWGDIKIMLRTLGLMLTGRGR